jgi:hypothetical protein
MVVRVVQVMERVVASKDLGWLHGCSKWQNGWGFAGWYRRILGP